MIDPNHPFAAMLRQMRQKKTSKQPAGGYATLTERQQAEWHADVYAFRRVLLQIPAHIHVSPPDPEGEHYDEELIAIAEQFYRDKYHKRRQDARKKSDEDDQREGRGIVNGWAWGKGYKDLDDMAEKLGVPWIDLYRQHMREFAAANAKLIKRMPR